MHQYAQQGAATVGHLLGKGAEDVFVGLGNDILHDGLGAVVQVLLVAALVVQSVLAGHSVGDCLGEQPAVLAVAVHEDVEAVLFCFLVQLDEVLVLHEVEVTVAPPAHPYTLPLALCFGLLARLEHVRGFLM